MSRTYKIQAVHAKHHEKEDLSPKVEKALKQLLCNPFEGVAWRHGNSRKVFAHVKVAERRSDKAKIKMKFKQEMKQLET